MSTFPYKFDLNETLISCLTDFYLINCLANYIAYMADKHEFIYEFSKQSKFFHKFNNYDFYSTQIVL